MIDFLVDYLFLALPVLLIGGIVMQVRALRRYRGGWRIAAWVPALAMAAALAVAVLGGLAGSNLAPIWVVFALPPCFVWLTALTVAHGAWGWAARD
jgi:hypothetical protein